MSAVPSGGAAPDRAPIAGHAPGSAPYRRLLIGLFFAGVATFAQLYSPQAVLPSIAAHFRVGAADAALTVSAATIGLAVGVLPWAAVADRVGRIRAMAIGILVATSVGLLAPFSPTLPVLLGARLVEGLALASVPALAVVYLSEEVTATAIARAAGTYVAGTTVGGLAGRIVAGPIADLADWRIGVFTVAALCAASAVAFVLLVPAAQGFVPARRRADAPGALRSALAGLARALRSPRQLAVDAQGFLLMGGFVAVYNYLGFRLAAPPFELPATLVSLLFLAYLAGTFSSARAGALASRRGRLPVLLGSIGVMAGGVAVTLVPALPAVIVGLVVLTAGFFGAHSVASGWAPLLAGPARAQASSLYNLAYYGGSSLVGWAAGLLFATAGWTPLAVGVIGLSALAAVIATFVLRRGTHTSG